MIRFNTLSIPCFSNYTDLEIKIISNVLFVGLLVCFGLEATARQIALYSNSQAGEENVVKTFDESFD